MEVYCMKLALVESAILLSSLPMDVELSWLMAMARPAFISCHNWTAPYLATQIHRSSILLMIFRVKRSPFSPSGENVADRPDEGLSRMAAF